MASWSKFRGNSFESDKRDLEDAALQCTFVKSLMMVKK